MKNLSLNRDSLLKIISSANEGIYVTDKDRKFLIWNTMAEKITGYRSDEVIGRYCHDNILDHTDRDGTPLCNGRCPLSCSMENRNSCGPEIVYLRHKDGRKIPVEVSTSPIFDEENNVIGSVELFVNITRRLESDRQIADKKQKLEAVLDNISEGILFLDSSGTVNLHNGALLNFLELTGDIRGKSIFTLPAHDILRQAVFRTDKSYNGPFCWELNHCDRETDCTIINSSFCRCWLLSRERESPSHHTLCMDCPAYKNMKLFLEQPKELHVNGKTLSVLSSFAEFRDKNEIWEILVFRDVAGEKLDAVMKLAKGAAHEMRQPLQVIIGAVSLIEDEVSGNADAKKYLDALEESCYRLNDIVKRLGDITSYQTIKYSEGIDILDITKSSKKQKRNSKGNGKGKKTSQKHASA